MSAFGSEHTRPWWVEQHVDVPALAGQWLLVKRFGSEEAAETRAMALRLTSSERETFRVRKVEP